MPMAATRPRRTARAASLRRLPLSLVHPVVLTFLAAGYFSYVSGDSVRAGYLLAVGLALAWDRSRRGQSDPAAQPAAPDTAERVTVFSPESVQQRRALMNKMMIPALLAGAAFAVIVGLLPRYSWPATIAVCVPAVAGVLLAWRVSAGAAGRPERLPAAGTIAWAVVWVGAAMVELTALYLQPTLTTDSSAHPTLSYLADPVLASVPGRSIVLLLWLAFGWYLARR
jgi:hypothetical protein